MKNVLVTNKDRMTVMMEADMVRADKLNTKILYVFGARVHNLFRTPIIEKLG
jgi:hypothetical protein